MVGVDAANSIPVSRNFLDFRLCGVYESFGVLVSWSFALEVVESGVAPYLLAIFV